MRRLVPSPVPAFQPVEASSPEFSSAWATSFLVAGHVYSLRVEQANMAMLGLDGFCLEQGIPRPDGGAVYFLKFDNALNELDAQSAFGRLPPDKRLSPGHVRQLAAHLAGGIALFCQVWRPDLLLGVPNDLKLDLWYRHLCGRAALPGYRLDVCRTAYHSHGVLLIQRLRPWA